MIALISGIGAALYGMLVYFDGELLVETLFIPLLLSACLTYARWRNARKAFLIIIPGFFLGLAMITRPSALIILPVFIGDMFFSKGIIPGTDLPIKRLLRVFVLVTGCCLPILPITGHNVLQGGDFVLIGSSGGINFYIGNNPQADGLHSVFPDIGTNWEVSSTDGYLTPYWSSGRIQCYLREPDIIGFHPCLVHEPKWWFDLEFQVSVEDIAMSILALDLGHVMAGWYVGRGKGKGRGGLTAWWDDNGVGREAPVDAWRDILDGK